MHGTIDLAQNSDQNAARERAYSIPLEQFDPGDPELFRSDTFWPYFDRLRKEAPVHYCRDSVFGPYWSVTKYNDIMDIETNHSVFSSAASLGGITIRDIAPDLRRESFIAMDQPRHGAQRKTVAPMFTPTHLDQLAINIRKRSAECLDNLTKNDVFDWVDQVSIELSTQLRENPALIDSFVPEVIRWQTPLAHMRRTALEDVEFRGKRFKKGDKVVMWYVSGNRDDEVIDRPYEFIIDRARPRTHISFGFGIHRCVGIRLAELQLKIIWEEILKRFDTIEVVAEPKRVYSSFVKGYETLPVRIAG